MPSDMRLQCPSEDTPPSTRPPSVASSAASNSGTPHRSTSMDSLHTNSSTEKSSGEEYIPTRLIRPTPKVNVNAMQFVKTGPAMLHRSAKEQMKKVEIVKSLRKTSLQEEEEWQSSSSSVNMKSLDEGSDWQMNLDKWKSSRRKRNEDVLERVIEVKKNEKEDEFSQTRRKSKTFSEMREEKTKRGRRYNLVVHDDDNNDLSDLGLGLSSAKNGQSLSDAPEEGEAKSDAGFCTGSDTGSDGVFAEDNISDTSSALGDKREIHDSLLESGSPPSTQKNSGVILNGHHLNGTSTTADTSMSTCSVISDEYTYDKAIEEYKQFAENSVKKRTSSVTSLSSNASGSKDDQDKSVGGRKLDDKFSFYEGGTREPKVVRRERTAAKVDIGKRRSMFELRDIDQHESRKTDPRRSFDVSSSLRSKVASFENVNDSENRSRIVKPLRDTKFKEKLESFSKKERFDSNSLTQRKTPERDQNFYQKLQNFTELEARTSTENLTRKTSPERKYLRKSFESKISPTAVSSGKVYEKKSSPPPMPLKERIASFENLSPTGSAGKRELSVSMENLHNKFASSSDESRGLQASQSVTNLFRRIPSTPYMVVEVDEEAEEKTCVKRNVSRVSSNEGDRSVDRSKDRTKRLTVYEEIEKVVIQRDVSKAPLYSIFKEDYEVKSSLLEKLESNRSTKSSLEREPLTDKPRPRTQTGEIPSRTLPEVPPSKPSRALPEPPSPPRSLTLSISRSLPETPSPEAATSKICSETRTSRILPEIPKPRVPEDPDSSSRENFETLPQVPDIIPPKEPEIILNWMPDSSISSKVLEPPPSAPEMAPPPVPPPRVPTIEDPYLSMSSFSTNEDSKEHTYGDEDIDEVIGEEVSSENAYPLHVGTCIEKGYEKQSKINVFETVTPETSVSSLDVTEESLPPHYQPSDEAAPHRAGRSPSPSPPRRSKNLAVFEVLDVTWTENSSSSPAAPPSVPPPPPPPEEEEEEEPDEPTEVGGVVPLSNTSLTPSDREESKIKTVTTSSQSTKQDLRRMMSDFLGTNPQVEEELTLQPPPDLSELLRQERDAERLIVQKQANLKRESPLLEFDYSVNGQPSSGRPRYTWEDRMKADGPKTEKNSHDDSVDSLEFHTKLAELEQEMEKHDRNMLQRLKGPAVQDQTEIYTEEVAEAISPLLQYPEKLNSRDPVHYHEMNNTNNRNNQNQNSSTTEKTTPLPPQPSSSLPVQEFYSAPSYKNEPVDSIYNHHVKTSQENLYSESTSVNLDTKRVVDRDPPPKSLPEVPPPVPRKQSILALSAIPKPKLTDSDSWIMKKKSEGNKKDYSKHWLIQEAEQRRLEQQERITRPMQIPVSKPLNTLHSAPGYQNHFQNIKSSFHSPTHNQLSNSVTSNTNNSSTLANTANTTMYNVPNTIHSTNESSNKYIYNNNMPSSNPPSSSSCPPPPNHNWMKQTKTYQPPQAASPTASNGKPLPDAIISSITQRVNNKINGRTPVYNSANNTIRSEENYHDYMNTGSFNSNYSSGNSTSNNSPVSASPSTQGSHFPTHLPSPGSQQSPLSEDQRLLSVSGKKKCSHCGEELGRGAAMIIESLRLFYHIPCFKCCVCGIQLGNGTSGADVRVRNHKLHCHNCYSNDEGMKFSKV